MVAQDAQYHVKCLTALYNQAGKQKIECNEKTGSSAIIHGIVLPELLAYIEDIKHDDDVAPAFRLANLVKLYENRLTQLGLKFNQGQGVHSTRLKNRILSHFNGMSAYKSGRDVMLAFNKDIGNAVLQASSINHDEDTVIHSKSANIVRQDIFLSKQNFNGTFSAQYQQESVSKSLFALVSMILGGPNIMIQAEATAKLQAAYTIAQLLEFNSRKQRRTDSTKQYHKVCQETPAPLYLRLFAYAATSQYHEEKVVFPLSLRLSLFTNAAVDNIDHNLSSTTATMSFHGTGISLFQQPSTSAQGIDHHKRFGESAESREKRMHPLPDFYTSVTPATFKKVDMFVPKTIGYTGPKFGTRRKSK